MKLALAVLFVSLVGCAPHHIQCRIIRDGTKSHTPWHSGLANCEAGAEVMHQQQDPNLSMEYKGPAGEVRTFWRWFKGQYDHPAIDLDKEREKQEQDEIYRTIVVRK